MLPLPVGRQQAGTVSAVCRAENGGRTIRRRNGLDEYAEFRKRFEVRHPASIPRHRRVLSEYPRWLQGATLVMFICSAILSGVHTIPVVRAGIPADIPARIADAVSLTAFVSVEIAILLSSYAMIGGSGLAVRGVLLLATLTALTANIYSVLRAYRELTAGEPGTLMVAVIIGVVAPGIAFLSGKLFVSMGRADLAAREQAEAEYLRACREWDARIEREWLRTGRKSGRTDVQNAVRPDGQTGQPIGQSGQLFVQQRPAELIRTYLSEHPEDINLSVRELATRLGVGKSTVASIRTELFNTRAVKDNGKMMHDR